MSSVSTPSVMKISSSLHERKERLYLLATLVLVTVFFTCLAVSNPTIRDNSDQTNIGLMEAKLDNPALFSRDYVFQDTSLFRFYTPVFINLVSWLKDLVGSFEGALAALVPIVLLIYLPGMFLFVYRTTKSVLVASVVAVISSLEHPAIAGTFWGVAGIESILPRTLFLMFVPWFLLLLFHWINRETWWHMPLVAFLIGLTANLHPVSGFVFLQLFLSLLILEYGVRWRTVRIVLTSVLAAVVGVWPTLYNFVQHTALQASATPTVDFELFYNVIHLRLITVFPFRQVALPLHQLTPGQQQFAVWLYLLAMLIWLGTVAWFMARRKRQRVRSGMVFTALLAIQLPMALLVGAAHPLALVLIAGAYAYLVARSKIVPDRWDWRMAGLLVLAICYSFVASYFLDIIWREFEIWQLTTIVGEQARVSRFIYLPLFFFLARFLRHLQLTLPVVWLRVGSIIALGIIAALHWVLVVALLAGLVLVTLFYFTLIRKSRRKPIGRLLLTATFFILILIGGVQFFRSGAASGSEIPAETRELYEWAREETHIDSLFYYDSLDFRFWARRSITHAWKDLGFAYYSQDQLVPFYERFVQMHEAYADENQLLQAGCQYDVDYIIVAPEQELSLDLPVAFANEAHTVFELNDSACSP